MAFLSNILKSFGTQGRAAAATVMATLVASVSLVNTHTDNHHHYHSHREDTERSLFVDFDNTNDNGTRKKDEDDDGQKPENNYATRGKYFIETFHNPLWKWRNDNYHFHVSTNSTTTMGAANAYSNVNANANDYMSSTRNNHDRCLCESPPFSKPPPTSTSPNDNKTRTQRKTLQRNQTIKRIKKASIKSQTLHSLYHFDLRSPPLGEGAFGTVFSATRRRTSERVALKRIPKKMTDDESFQREMNALLHIRESGGHPQICALRDSFDEGAYYYITLDFVGGGEMFDHLVESGAYSEANASRLVREVASALAFLHGIGVVHNDLKPENLMLSSRLASNAVIKLVDFGCASILGDDDGDNGGGDDKDCNDNANTNTSSTTSSSTTSTSSTSDHQYNNMTVAYSPPESLTKSKSTDRPTDMWALGIILYIMLTGVHPFDITADADDKTVACRIRKGDFPLRNSEITSHLSESAIDLIERLMERDPEKRLTADQMLDHPWVTGETATTDIIKGSDQRLSKLRIYKSKIEAKIFRDLVAWSDEALGGDDETRRRTSLIERSFRSLDEKNRGFLTEQDLGRGFDGVHKNNNENGDNNNGGGAGPSTSSDQINTFEDEGEPLSISDFQSLLSENMKEKFFPKGTVIYREGEIGNHMYFINSGTIEVVTNDGSRAVRTNGDFFGEGALLHPKRIRSATIYCKTPVHAFRISRKYFDKYLSNSESGLLISLREKDKIRKRNRCKAILRLQNTLRQQTFEEGEHLFYYGDDGDSLFIVEEGQVDLTLKDKKVFIAMPGNIIGEHSLLTGNKRNCNAICAMEGGCTVQILQGHDFRKLTDASPEVLSSLTDLCLRRDFKKAVVHRLGSEFPYHDARKAYDAVKTTPPGSKEPLGVEEIRSLMKDMDSDYDDLKIMELIDVIDLTNTGNVSFDEFKKVFIADLRSSASM